MTQSRVSYRRPSLISLFAAILFTLTCASALVAFTPEEALAEDISTTDDFVTWCNEGSNSAKLLADITITDEDIDRISEAGRTLSRYIHGENHTITLNLTRYPGLFSKIESHVLDLRLQGSVNCPNTVGVGALASELRDGGYVGNVINFADVTGASTVGGIVGSIIEDVPNVDEHHEVWEDICMGSNANYGTITAYGTSTKPSNVGGIAGEFRVTGSTLIWDNYVGIAYSIATVSDCYNAGTIVGYKKNTAGIFGETIASGKCKANVSYCYNVGTIKGGNKDAAGITAHATNNTSITKCYNAGAVTADDLSTAHGIVHWNQANGEFSYNYSVDVKKLGWVESAQNGKVVTKEYLCSEEGAAAVGDGHHYLPSTAGENKGYPVLSDVGEGKAYNVTVHIIDNVGKNINKGKYRAPYGRPLQLPEPPEYEGRTFQYWTMTSPGSNNIYDTVPTPFDVDAPYYEGDRHLYTYYSLNPMTVNFDATQPNGEIAKVIPSSITAYYGRPYGEMPAPQSTGGFIFDFWAETNEHGDETVIKPTDVVTQDGGSKTLVALWRKSNLYFSAQPADVTVAENETATFQVRVSDSHKFDDPTIDDYEGLLYQWYWCTDPNDVTTYTLIDGATEPTYTTKPLDCKDGNLYFFCDVYGHFGVPKIEYSKFLFRSRMAHVTMDIGNYVEASVDTGKIKIVPDSKKKIADRETYEYDVPITVSLTNVEKLANEFSGARFTVLLPGVGEQYTFTHEVEAKDFAQKTFTFVERIRQTPNVNRNASIKAAFTAEQNKSPHEAVFMPEMSTSFWVPDATAVPTSTTKVELFAGGEYSDIWNPGLAALPEEPERISVGNKITAIAEMTWGSNFVPTDSNFEVTWQYNAGNAEWVTIEGINTQTASTQQGDGTTRTRIVGTFTAGLEHNGAQVRAVVGMKDDRPNFEPQHKTCESSDPLNVSIPAPTNVQLNVSNTKQVLVEWPWDPETQGIPCGVGDKGDFLITYSYKVASNVGGTNNKTYGVTGTVVMQYNPNKKVQQASIADPQSGSEYTVTVQAVANRELGPQSSAVTATTPGTPPSTVDITPHEIALGYNEVMPITVLYEPGESGRPIEKYQWELSSDGTTWKVDEEPVLDETNEATYLFTYKEGGPTFIRCHVSGDAFEQVTPATHVVRAFNIPTDFKATAQTYSAELSWKGDSDVANYVVRWTDATSSKPADDYWNYVQVGSATSLKLEGLKANRVQHWQVAALPSDGVAASYDWTDCPWGDKPDAPGAFKTLTAPKVGTWTLKQTSPNPHVAGQDRISMEVSSTDYVNKTGTTLTYEWQYRDANEQDWQAAPPDYNYNQNGEFTSKYSLWLGDDMANVNVYGRSWRCVVKASTSFDGISTYTTNEVVPVIQPPKVEGIKLLPGVDTMKVTWLLSPNVDTYNITYGSIESNNDLVNPSTITVGSQGSAETVNYYSTFSDVVEGTLGIFTLTNLPADTTQRVIIEGVKLGQHSEAGSADAKTLSPDDLPVVAGDVSGQYVTVGSTDEATFSVPVVRPTDGSELSGVLECFVPSEDGTSGTWEEVAKASVPTTRSLEEIVHLTVALRPQDGTWRYNDALKVRFAVTKTMSDGTMCTAYTNPVSLKTVSTAPTVSVVEGSATTSSVEVKLDGTKNGVPITNRFAVLWTDNPKLSTSDLGGWKRLNVDADENGMATYTISGLTPGATHRIVALSAPVVDGIDQPVSGISNVAEATTISTNPLTSVAVTPERTVAPLNTQVDLVATPAFDGDPTTVTYQWQSFVMGSGWQDIAGATKSTLKVTVDTSLADAYRCVVTAGGMLTTNMEKKEVTSNRATLFADGRPDAPTGLSVSDVQLRSALVSWTGPNRFAGEYKIEYRALGTEEWLVAYAGETSCTLDNLEPRTTYEWRVTSESSNGLSSLPTPGPAFATTAGSTLKNAWLTPSESVIVIDADDAWKSRKIQLSVTNDADPTEALTYSWKYSDDGGTTWTPFEAGTTYEASMPAFESQPGTPCVGERLYRCDIVAELTGSEGQVVDTAQVASNTASLRLVPNAPSGLSATVSAAAATVEWNASTSGVASTYEVQYRAKNAEWATAAAAVEASGGTGSYEIANLTPGVYEWRVRTVGTPTGATKPTATYASEWVEGTPFIIKAGSGLSVAVVSPQVATYTTEPTSFAVETDAPDPTKLTYKWQWRGDGILSWTDVETGDNFELDGASLRIKQAFYSEPTANGARFHCIVSETSNPNSTITSNEVKLVQQQAVDTPTGLQVSDIGTASASLSWEDYNDSNKGSYTLQWRAVGQPTSFASFMAAGLGNHVLLSGDQALLASIDASGWNTVTDIHSKIYSLDGELQPGTQYEWRVQYVSASGEKSPMVDGPVFTTLTGSALTSVVVTPKVAVGKAGEKVTFTAVTNVDGATNEKLFYTWKKAPRGTDKLETGKWEIVQAYSEQKTLQVTIEDDDLGTQYLCVVDSHKSDDNGFEIATKTLTSDPVSVWKPLEVTKPSDLKFSEVSLTTVQLSWTCKNAQMEGTFTVEYRMQNSTWQKVSGITGKEYKLENLMPNQTYEWRVSHVIAEGLESGFVNGDTFTTLADSALTSVTITPSSVTTTPNVKTILTATPNKEAAGEKLTHQWQYFSEPGGGGGDWTNHKSFEATQPTFPVQGDQYDTSRYRCIITNPVDGTTATSDEVLLRVVPVAPDKLEADVGTNDTNKAKLSWTTAGIETVSSQDSATYEVAWRSQDSKGWNTKNVDAKDGASLQLTGLKSSTAYEWRVRIVVEVHDEKDPFISEWSDTSSFVTASTSGLSKASVTPSLLKYDEAKYDEAKGNGAKGDVEFKVSTDAPPTSYRWQWKSAHDDNWKDVENGQDFKADNNTLTVYQSFANKNDGYDTANDARFRCIVSSDEGKEVTSSEGVLVQTAAGLMELNSDTTSHLVTVSWDKAIESDVTYTLQYRKTLEAPVTQLSEATTRLLTAAAPRLDDEGWMTKEGIEEPWYRFDSLDPSARYEWRVKYVKKTGEGQGEWVLGTPFDTPETPAPGPGPQPGPEPDPEPEPDPSVEVPTSLVPATVKATSVHLTWSCDQPGGTFIVEYRVKPAATPATLSLPLAELLQSKKQADTDWQKVTVTQPEVTLENLQPNTTYEWRVTHVLADGTTSSVIKGPDFTTLGEDPEPDPSPEPGPGPNPDPAPGTDPQPQPGSNAGQGTGGKGGTSGSGGGVGAKALTSTGDPVPVGMLTTLATFAAVAATAVALALTKRRTSSKPTRHQK